MRLQTCRFLTLLLSALSLGMAFAHLLEMPAKLRYHAQLYTAVQGTLYHAFGVAGAVVEPGSVLGAVALTLLARGRQAAFRWSALGAACLASALVTWLVVVAPVNRLGRTDPAEAFRRRQQWEYGHAARAAMLLCGFSALVLSVLTDTREPGAPRPESEKARPQDSPIPGP